MGRSVIVGDVHGCRQELEALLALVRFVPKADRLILVGDLVTRGPDSLGTLAVVKGLDGRAVRGNHEEKLLARRQDRTGLGAEHRRIAAAFSDEQWRMLEAMPLWLDLPEHGIRVVHGGVLPGLDVERTPREALLQIRSIDAFGRWSDKRDGGVPWATGYAGPPHVVFGHNALPEPQLHAWATGIDTGCVYGGRLTAVVLGSDEGIPRGEQARSKLASVPALRKYSG
jgi:hypothetical protein